MMSSGQDKEQGGSRFPGVTSLFSRRGFPGTVKATRQSNRSNTLATDAHRQLNIIQQSIPMIDTPSTNILPSIASDNGQQDGTPSTSASLEENIGKNAAVANDLPSSSTPNDIPSTNPTVASVSTLRSMSEPRVAKFNRLLNQPVVDIEALKELSWSGIPAPLRPLCWRLLLGYLPPNRERREQILDRKRREYRELIPEYYESAAGPVQATAHPTPYTNNNSNNSSSNINNLSSTKNMSSTAPSNLLGNFIHSTMGSEEESALRQVAVDVPRTAPGVAFFHLPRMQKVLERILYIWGVRHPASGYVQGINDLATPFLAVYMSEKMPSSDLNTWTLDNLTESEVLDIEADCYWCLCKMLDGIQDHYTYSQPGIQRTLFHVQELVGRVNAPVASHLEKENVEFMQFAFRWTNCLLLRELPFTLGQRLWDTYLAEGSGLKEFLVYVLSSFLLSWGSELTKMEFQDLIMFLQRVPTAEWTESDVELVLSRAYMWRTSFKGATSHFG